MPRRSRSTTPLQSLNLLNSSFTMQQAQRFAARLRAEAPDDVVGQIHRAHALCLGRDATAEEVTANIFGQVLDAENARLSTKQIKSMTAEECLLRRRGS